MRTLGQIGVDFARDTADVTDRENIQYHWIRVEDVPEIWDRLDAAGLSSLEACGDSPRPFLGSPVAGVAADEIIDGTSALEEIFDRFIGDPDFSNFPRKFKTALTGHPGHDVCPETNDVSFVGTVHPEHGPGFDCWVGGGLSTNPMLAAKIGVWIPLDEVADVWAAVASVFRDYGYRRLRSRARLKFLVADWGVEKFREVMEKEYLGRELVSCESPASPVGHRDHIGVHDQKDGLKYVGVAPVAGRVSGTLLVQLADLIEEYGVAGARLTPYQKIVLIGVRPEVVEELVSRLDAIGLSARPVQLAPQHDGLHRHRVLQARHRRHQGARPRRWSASSSSASPSSTCRSPSTSTAAPTPAPAPRSPTSASRASWSCSDGEQVEGFQVHLGGATGLQANFGRKLRAHKVTSAGLDDYVTAVVTNYLVDRVDADESFATWVARADEELLRGEKVLSPLMSERAVPFHCAYCGDTNLWPHEATHGAWECRDCQRVFSVKMLGTLRPEGVQR